MSSVSTATSIDSDNKQHELCSNVQLASVSFRKSTALYPEAVNVSSTVDGDLSTCTEANSSETRTAVWTLNLGVLFNISWIVIIFNGSYKCNHVCVCMCV